MKLNVYAIRDVHTGYLNPTVDYNDASALRNFAHAVMNTESLMNSHAKDYSLYKIGEFDSELGSLIPVIPQLIIDAYSVL